MRKKIIAVVFLFLIFICWYIPVSDNPVLVFIKQPIHQTKQFIWAVRAPFKYLSDNSAKSYCGALNGGLQSYRREFFPSYEKIIGRNFAHFHGDIQGLLDIRKVGAYIKLNTGHIANLRVPEQIIDPALLEEMTRKTIRFNSFLEKNNISFLFTVFPDKMHKKDQQFLCHIEDYANENADNVIQAMTSSGIDCYDSRELYLNNPKKHYESFFIGDHHWNEEYAFETFKRMAAKMSKARAITVDERILNKENYTITEEPYPWQEQSAYKNLGKHYAVLAEIQDRMKFQISHKSPIITNEQNGLFHYHSDNEFSSNYTILIIHDSFFSYMLTPCTLAFRDVYTVDTRSYGGAITDLISKVSPDYVIFAISAHQFERRVFRFNSSTKYPESNSPLVNP